MRGRGSGVGNRTVGWGRTLATVVVFQVGVMAQAPSLRAEPEPSEASADGVGLERPRKERAVVGGEAEAVDTGIAAPAPENMEDALYLRERPDALGRATRAFHDKLLDKLLREREALVVTRRKHALRLLRDFVRSEPETAPEMPDALLRLAELEWETSRSRYLAAFEKWQATAEGIRGDEPKPDYRRAFVLYRRLL
ncbi:MAG: hypothetical protein KC416_11295, partial [Myxococcales bacterium]|nr:hypothetical protein [Myxococcales bacterium]